MSGKFKKLIEDKLGSEDKDYRFNYLVRVLRAPLANPKEGEANIEMEACMGGNLMHHINAYGRPQLYQCISWLFQMALGLEGMQVIRYLHTDLKPENVVITHNGQLKICDYGLAKHTPRGRRNSLCGTDGYLPPERFTSYGCYMYGYASDIYAMGVSMFLVVAGYFPYSYKVVPKSCPSGSTYCWHLKPKARRIGRVCKCWKKLPSIRGWTEDTRRDMEDLINWMIHPIEEKRMALIQLWTSKRTKWMDKVIEDYFAGGDDVCTEDDFGLPKTRTHLRNSLLVPHPDRRVFCDDDTFYNVQETVLKTMDKLSRQGKTTPPKFGKQSGTRVVELKKKKTSKKKPLKLEPRSRPKTTLRGTKPGKPEKSPLKPQPRRKSTSLHSSSDSSDYSTPNDYSRPLPDSSSSDSECTSTPS